jgi:hypothetical protein
MRGKEDYRITPARQLQVGDVLLPRKEEITSILDEGTHGFSLQCVSPDQRTRFYWVPRSYRARVAGRKKTE